MQAGRCATKVFTSLLVVLHGALPWGPGYTTPDQLVSDLVNFSQSGSYLLTETSSLLLAQQLETHTANFNPHVPGVAHDSQTDKPTMSHGPALSSHHQKQTAKTDLEHHTVSTAFQTNVPCTALWGPQTHNVTDFECHKQQMSAARSWHGTPTKHVCAIVPAFAPLSAPAMLPMSDALCQCCHPGSTC